MPELIHFAGYGPIPGGQIRTGPCHCCHGQVIRIRRDVLRSYRESHGHRIKLDHGGQTSIELGMDIRLKWACGEWSVMMQDVANKFANRALLQAWGVLRPADFDDADPIDEADVVDDFLLCSLESICRVFWGLHARSLVLWSGGIYHQVKLCSSDPSLRAQAVRRASVLWHRIMILENMLVDKEGVDPEIKTFNDGFLWHHGTCYRELHCLLSEGFIAQAVTYSWQMHSCPYHEKGSWTKYDNQISFIGFIQSFCLFRCFGRWLDGFIILFACNSGQIWKAQPSRTCQFPIGRHGEKEVRTRLVRGGWIWSHCGLMSCFRSL